ncbi:MAG: TonB-dependent receptor [Acidobacteria bacterium]|nr:TonB-dependent receptor [Acidobacteriota bacterium]
MRTMESQRGSWRTFGVLVFLASWLVVGVALRAQQPTGTILGVVKDATGGVIPGTSITVSNTQTGFVRMAMTGQDGSFRLPALPVGSYQIVAEHPGFQREVRSDLTLNIGQEAVLNFSLQVGAVEQTIAVTAEAPMIETTSAVVSGLVNENEVRDLPLNARNLIELGTLFAGVSINETGGQGVPNGFATKLSILGTRYNANLFQLDGANINDNTGSAGSAAGILMGVETVREFNVITSGYSAEYGQHSGGVFNAVTKSGTNEIHGSVFEFLRNDELDAYRWEQKAFPPTGQAPLKPEYKRNQYGFALGGPFVHDRTFWFGSYESLRDRSGLIQNFSVPNSEMRQGRLPLTIGSTVGALTAAQCTAVTVGGTVTSDGNYCQVPVNALMRPYLESWPLSNGEQLPSGLARYLRAYSLPTNEHFYTFKVDHRFLEKDSIFGRYTFDGAEKATGASIAWFNDNNTRTQYAALSHTRLVSPQVINVLLLGFNRSRITTQHSPVTTGEKGFPLRSFTAHEAPVGTIGTGSPSPSGMGGGGFIPTTALLNQYQLKDDVFYTLTTHSLKFGFNFQRMQFLRDTYFNGGGSYSYNQFTDFLQNKTLSIQNTRVNGIPIGVQDGARNFTGMTPASDPKVYPRQSLFGLYLQDDWRVNPQLTLNLGLRYEITSTPHVLNERFSNFPHYFTAGKSYPQDFVLGNPPWINPSLKNFAPRFGFAWDPTGGGKTSIRGGVGIFYDQLLVGPIIFSFVSTPPYFANGELDVRVAASGPGIAPKFPDAALVQAVLLGGRPQTEPIQFDPEQPVLYKWSFDVQQSITPTTSVELGYSGNRALHLMRMILTNTSIAQELNGRLFVPPDAPIMFPNIARVRPKVTDGQSNFHAFRLQINQRMTRGLQLRTAYTFSKALDTGSTFAGSADFTNDSQPRYQGLQAKARAAFDLRHNLNVNFTYDLPGRNLTGALGQILGGWQTSGIITATSGTPSDVSTGYTPNQFNTIGGYPDFVAGSKVKYDPRNPDKYFDETAFTVPGLAAYPTTFPAPANPGYIGNLARNFLDGPGNYVWNFVLAKKFAVTERVSLQFRTELFNMLNRPNFGTPNATLFNNQGIASEQIGRITSTRGTAREIQLGLKVEF